MSRAAHDSNLTPSDQELGATPFRIRAARVIVTSPGRNFVTLKIETDQGLHGLGDATLNGRESSAVASYLDRPCASPTLIGRDAQPDRGHLAVPLQAARIGGAGR